MQIGIDDSEVHYKFEEPKSIGNSVTLPMDIKGLDKIEEIVLTLTEQVTYRLRKYELSANVVNVQLRTKDFLDYSHQRKLIHSSNSTREIYEIAKEITKEMYKGDFIRLVGVRCDELCNKNQVQLSIFDNSYSEKQEKIDKSIDKIKEKYGYDFIKRGGIIEAEKIVKLKRKE